MLHPMPWRYRLLVWFVGVLSFAGVGIWLALATPIPVLWSTGALVGVVLGVAAVAAFLRSLERTPADEAQRTPRAG